MPRILIMEDNLQLALEWRDVFELNGHQVVLTHSGEEAISVLRDGDVDLVISDLFVTGRKGGLSVIGALRTMRRKAPPVIAVTGASSIGDDEAESRFLVQARRLGASDSIKKPFPPAELVVLADRLLLADC